MKQVLKVNTQKLSLQAEAQPSMQPLSLLATDMSCFKGTASWCEREMTVLNFKDKVSDLDRAACEGFMKASN